MRSKPTPSTRQQAGSTKPSSTRTPKDKTQTATPASRPSAPVARAKKMPLRISLAQRQAAQMRERQMRQNDALKLQRAGGEQELRLQKALAQTGIGSRRDMEAAIAAGRVTVNGQVAELGSKVKPGDKIMLDKRNIFMKWEHRLPRIVIYHKQEGELVSRDDPKGRVTVFERLPKMQSSRWIAIGRLDFNTSGLLIFTTSGDLANQMMHPRFEMEREYAVRVLGELLPEQKAALLEGITLDDGEARIAYIRDDGGEGINHWYRIVIKEGRNREVRRLFEHFGLTVSRLIRVRFGSLHLPSRLKRGQWVELPEQEVRDVLAWVKQHHAGIEQPEEEPFDESSLDDLR